MSLVRTFGANVLSSTMCIHSISFGVMSLVQQKLNYFLCEVVYVIIVVCMYGNLVVHCITTKLNLSIHQLYVNLLSMFFSGA